jgi:tight adherence protein B
MSPVMLIAAVCLVICITGMSAYFILSAQNERRKRLLQVVQGGAQAQGRKTISDKEKRRQDLAKKLKEGAASETAEKKSKGETLSQKLIMAGIQSGVRQFWIVSIICSAVVAMGFYLWNGSPLVAAMVFIAALFGGSKIVLGMMIKHRQKKFIDDLADALESMQRMLKAGMPVSECIKMVSREFTGPVGEEMGRIFDQQKIGVPLPEAVLEASKRMPIPEMQMFATAIAIQTQTGSSLSEVLENLAGVIRARFRLKRKIQALSAEAKASAMIIGSLPILVGGGMYFINNSYFMILINEGQFLMYGAIAWMSLGILVMRQMINFKV